MVKRQEIFGQQRKGLRWFALILILVCELLAHAWIRTESTQTMLRISKGQAKIQKDLSYRKALVLERERLKTDDRITMIARTRLGLTSDIFNRTIYLSGELN
ncbi:MAG: cell division protein FtsL [Desulfobacter sp.]|nr:cell division protein FtsL [Desulfobacter sp.]WDP85490.1 MAG: cell division protein FtsL [Desulfobacter sp.]